MNSMEKSKLFFMVQSKCFAKNYENLKNVFNMLTLEWLLRVLPQT